jgi:hypothetical protein
MHVRGCQRMRDTRWLDPFVLGALLFLFFGSRSVCLGFDVTPAVHEFTAGSKGAVQFFQVSNPDSAPLVLQVLPRRVSYTLDGRQRLEEATNVFQIFPSRLVIPAGGKQRVRVTYIPKTSPPVDSLFKMLFKDLPVSVGPGGTNSGVKLTTEYHQLAVVRGGRKVPKLVVEAAGPAQGTNKFLAGLWEVIVRNDGDGFGRLGGLKGVVPFTGSTGTGSFIVTPALITNFQNVILLPRDRRRFLFAPPAGMEKEPGEVRLDL